MKIDVSKVKNIKGGSAAFSLSEEVDAAAFGYGELVLSAPLFFRGKVDHQNAFLVVEGTADGLLELTCHRCLKPFSHSFSVQVTETFSNQPEVVESDEEETVHLFEGNVIEITRYLLKEIYLSLPMQVLCSADCRGLCPGCGADLNTEACRCGEQEIDPRLAKLLLLKNQKEPE